MALSNSPQRFMLLVGIDSYPTIGKDLKGCVNDVLAVRSFLTEHFAFQKPWTLTSPPLSGPAGPGDCQQVKPTRQNILKAFRDIKKQARSGDYFLFFYAGHGACLQPKPESPPGRTADPALVLLDSDLRGWELNNELKDLHQMEVYVLVILDSCYSGGSWRQSSTTRFLEFLEVVNNQNSYDHIGGDIRGAGYRSASLDKSWSVNPEGFTLITACKAMECAHEVEVDGIEHGVFTSQLLRSLGSSPGITSDYRTIQTFVEHRVKTIKPQTPQLFGRDNLMFFENKEPTYTAVSTTAQFEGDDITIPLGKAHCIQKGVVFRISPPAPNPPFVAQVHLVDDFSCQAKIPPECLLLERSCGLTTVLSRWSLGEKILKICIDSSFDDRFKEVVGLAIQDRVVGAIEITKSLGDGSDVESIRLKKCEDGSVDIYGSETLIGYQGRVRGLDLPGQDGDEVALKSAIALSHLARYNEILNLRNSPASLQDDFDITLAPSPGEDGKLNVSESQQIRFCINNKGQDDIFLTVMCLSPCFRVFQLFPQIEPSFFLPAGKRHIFAFRMEIPSELKDYRGHGSSFPFRDIIRAIIVTGKPKSFKSLEIPKIRDVIRKETQDVIPEKGERTAVLEASFEWSDWYTKDFVVLTTARSM